jgi:hypothetical protein
MRWAMISHRAGDAAENVGQFVGESSREVMAF